MKVFGSSSTEYRCLRTRVRNIQGQPCIDFNPGLLGLLSGDSILKQRAACHLSQTLHTF